MPRLICKICKKEISISYIEHEKIVDINNWICINCVSVIYTKDYPAGKVTLFTPIGTSEDGAALGDLIMSQLVFDEYKKDNPDETVITTRPGDNALEMIKILKPDKIFVSEFLCDDKQKIEKLPQVINYRMMNELCNYARDGVYPKNIFKPDYVLPEGFDYVVLHIRNISKGKTKNMSLEEAYKITLSLSNSRQKIIVVGNDAKVTKHLPLGARDLRCMLTLNEIAGVLENCKLFIGKDSGMVHLAASCGCNIIAYGFVADKWHPKTDKEKYKAFNKDVKFDMVLDEIRNYLEEMK